MLAGPVTDQAALHGLLAKVGDLGLPLLSVRRIDPEQEQQPSKEAAMQRHPIRSRWAPWTRPPKW